VNPHAADGTDLIMPKLIVPAYFHPATHASEWAWLAHHAAQIQMVLLNPASGPGSHPDQAYLDVLDRLRSAGVIVAAYVDTNYGQRPLHEAMIDVGRYRDWYQVSGVFFDRAAPTANRVGHYADLARVSRDMGASVVAFNHGVHPIEAYADHADLLGTFEGPWNAYLELAVPRWVRSREAGRFFHLMHSASTSSFRDAVWLAARRNAGGFYVTDRGGANPWDGLPAGAPDPQALWTVMGVDRDDPRRV